jgi:hypothetical protein
MDGILICFTLAVSLIAVAPAHAYIDPSAGQSLVQIGIAVIAAGAFFLKLWYRRIIEFFSRRSSTSKTDPGQNRID